MSGIATGIAIAFELVVVVGFATWLVRRKRRGSSSDISTALERFLPGLLGRIVVLELDIWVSVWRLVFTRRQPERFYPANRSILGYLTIFAVFMAPIELSLVHILIPSATIAWIVTGVSAYGIFWVVGMYASIRMSPHSIEAANLTLRYGILGTVTIPWSAIESVAPELTRPSKAGDGLRVERTSSGEYAAWLMSAGQADVTIRLNTVVRPRGTFRWAIPVRAVHATVDRPNEFAMMLQSRLMPLATA